MHPETIGFIVGLALIGIGLYCLGRKSHAAVAPPPRLPDPPQPAPLAVPTSPPPAEFYSAEQRPAPPGLATTPPAALFEQVAGTAQTQPENPYPAPAVDPQRAELAEPLADDPHAKWLAAARAAQTSAGPCPPSTQ